MKEKISNHDRDNSEEIRGLVWKAREGFFVNCGTNSHLCMSLDLFMEQVYVPNKTRILYAPFMHQEDREYLEDYFNRYI